MHRCFKCERPADLCECIDNLRVEAAHIPTKRMERGRKLPDGQIPGVKTEYGTIKFTSPYDGTTKTLSRGYENIIFRNMDDAVAFADFLNSDAIFECRVPSMFLR